VSPVTPAPGVGAVTLPLFGEAGLGPHELGTQVGLAPLHVWSAWQIRVEEPDSV
jgi:hypothetical protein